MDNNTKDVLMALIPAVVVPIVGVIVVIVNRIQLKKMEGKVDGYSKDVNGYRKEVDGKMGLLIQTTKELATAQEKARAKSEDDAKKETGL